MVIPAFHEAAHIADTVATLRDALACVEARGGVEIVVVDDGSADRTAESARQAGADQVIVKETNQGKGAAVRAGVLAARGATIVFTDADLAYPPEQIVSLLERVEDGWRMVVGSRHHQATTTVVRARRIRQLGSRAVNVATMVLLLGVLRDTQCGLKAFEREAARALFGAGRVDGFAFDIELFHLADRFEIAPLEVPVQLVNSEQSTVRLVRDTARLIRDVLRIRWWDLRGGYRASTVAAPAVGDRTAQLRR